MKIALPSIDGKLNLHFGHCVGFDVFDIAEDGKTITAKSWIDAPPHEPGLLPRFLNEKGITHIIAGGMGVRARDLFAERGIKVTVGAASDDTAKLVGQFLSGVLPTGANACDH